MKSLIQKFQTFHPPRFLIYAVMLLAGIATWMPVFRHGFVYDDELFVVANTCLRDVSFVPQYFTDIHTMAGKGHAEDFKVFRPIRNISYFLDFQISGLNPVWWHVHNLLIHIFNTFLIIQILKRLLNHQAAAMLTGFLFLIHPVHTEVVNWIKCRDDLLALMFVLLAFLVFLNHREKGIGFRHGLSVSLLYLMACLSKVQAIVFPLLLIAFEWMMPGRPPDLQKRGVVSRILNTNTGPLTVALGFTGLGYLVWRHLFIGQSHQTGYHAGYLADGLVPTMLTMVRVFAIYLRLLVLPVHLIVDYSWIDPSTTLADFRIWLAAGVILLVVFAAVRLARKRPLPLFGLIWFFVFLLPVSNIIPTMQFMAERFLYLPFAGFALAIGSLLDILTEKKSRLLVLFLIIIPLCICLSHARSRVWRDNITLHTCTVSRTSSDVIRPRVALLQSLIQANRFKEALPLAETLWQRLGHDTAYTERQRAEHARNYGLCLWQTGKHELGIQLLSNAAAIDTTYANPYILLGIIAGMNQAHHKALSYFDKAFHLNPDSPDIFYNRAIALRSLNRIDEAVESLKLAISKGYGEPAAHQTLASIFWQQGHIREAVEVYREGLKLWPGDREMRRWYGQGKKILGKKQPSPIRP